MYQATVFAFLNVHHFFGRYWKTRLLWTCNPSVGFYLFYYVSSCLIMKKAYLLILIY